MRASISVLVLSALVLAFAAAFSAAGEGAPAKIVVFRPGTLDGPSQVALVRRSGATPGKHLALVNGVAAHVPAAAEAALKARAEVLRIDDDLTITAVAGKGGGKPQPPQPAQQTQWGVTRIGAPSAWALTTGASVKVAVIDTGIDLKHPDLVDNIAGGVNCINSRKSAADDNGHGTHVAGIIAAANNTIGVVGVGPSIRLYSVKVLNSSGTGTLSDLVDALQWCVDNGMDVANMSLSSTAGNDTFYDAIAAASDGGVVLVAAAGNSSGDVEYPAYYAETIAVAASDSDDELAWYSNFGDEIDLIAPGDSITSTYKGAQYATMSGTSMATPHVTGAAALVIARPVGAWDADGDGSWDPAEVQAKLEATAEDIGLDATSQGAGLVRADLAVQ